MYNFEPGDSVVILSDSVWSGRTARLGKVESVDGQTVTVAGKTFDKTTGKWTKSGKVFDKDFSIVLLMDDKWQKARVETEPKVKNEESEETQS
jgi:hypothetical protein